MEVGEDDNQILVNVYNRLYTSIGVPNVTKGPSAADLEIHLIKASLPFLRCAALLFANLTDVPAPAALHGKCLMSLLGTNNSRRD